MAVGLGSIGTFLLSDCKSTNSEELSFTAALILSALFLLIQAIQLPVYFKLGYTKAKFLSFVPFAAIMAGYYFLLRLPSQLSSLPKFLTEILNSQMLIPALSTLLISLLFISYIFSTVFYKNREF